MKALLLALAAVGCAAPALAAGDQCDRVIARAQAQQPDFADPYWEKLDAGEFTFRYAFYGRRGTGRVTAVVSEGERVPGMPETKIAWEENGEVFTAMLGPVAEQDRIPVCVRAIRGDFTLERLYQALKPRLRR